MSAKPKAVADPDMLAAPKAARRAAKRALELGIQTGTPVWVIRNGRMVDLTRERKARKPRPRSVRRDQTS